MQQVLVIAYGNPLRSDDGIAWQAAEALRRKLCDRARVTCVHQLTPELAEEVALADMVIFLDASSNGEPGQVACRAIFAAPGGSDFSHHFAPAEILDLCRRLYFAEPRAFLISINGKSFGHGHELSPAVIHAVPEVVAQVCKLIEHLRGESRTPEPFMSHGLLC
jgi:hydrogenase maturation protease